MIVRVARIRRELEGIGDIEVAGIGRIGGMVATVTVGRVVAVGGPGRRGRRRHRAHYLRLWHRNGDDRSDLRRSADCEAVLH